MKEQWLALAPEDLFGQETSSKDSGVTIRVFISPFDVPSAVRGYRDHESRMFRIEFRYPVEEETVPQKVTTPPSHLSLYVGRNSGRLQRIDVDIDALGAGEVRLEMVAALVDEAIGCLASKPSMPRRSANYNLTRKVISNHSRDLFGDLAVAI